jgi:hypothetical protein
MKIIERKNVIDVVMNGRSYCVGMTENNLRLAKAAAFLEDEGVLVELVVNGTKEVSLSGTWEKNKNIRYILELPTDAKEVKLTPKVNTWENETNNNINKDDVKDVTK